jgi:MazG family protein
MEHTRRLLEIMARLRDADRGCPWDLEQTFASLAPYTLEEAYEVVDALHREDFDDLRDELGDLLLQIVFHSQLAKERDLFDFEGVAAAICAKLVRRHPHVFDGVDFADDAERLRFWEDSKRIEREQKGKEPAQASILDGIATSFPALMEAQKLQQRAERYGFDWPDPDPVFAKVDEELAELRQARADADPERIKDEVGDLLFAVVNLARKLDVDAETALKAGNRKFGRRFRYIEGALAAQGLTLTDASLDDLDRLWDQAKREGH